MPNLNPNTSLIEKTNKLFNLFLAAVLMIVTPELTNMFAVPKKEQVNGVAVNKVQWAIAGFCEFMKAMTGSLMAAKSNDSNSQKIINIARDVLPPAICTTAVGFALAEKKFFGKPADAQFFAAGFLFDAIGKLTAAYGKYQKGEDCKNEMMAGIAMLFLCTGVVGILSEVPFMIVAAPLGALINAIRPFLADKTIFARAATGTSFFPASDQPPVIQSPSVDQPSSAAAENNNNATPLLIQS